MKESQLLVMLVRAVGINGRSDGCTNSADRCVTTDVLLWVGRYCDPGFLPLPGEKGEGIYYCREFVYMRRSQNNPPGMQPGIICSLTCLNLHTCPIGNHANQYGVSADEIVLCHGSNDHLPA